MGFAAAQMMTGAQTILLGHVDGWEFTFGITGKNIWHKVDLGVAISQAEWVKGLCGDHKPRFVREELDDHNKRYDVWKCDNCGLREMTPVRE